MMPHLTLVSMSGLRVREAEMLALGMSLPGLRRRAGAVGALPPLGLLTLAGMTPGDWGISLFEAAGVGDDVLQAIVRERPTLVAVSALTASIDEAYALCGRLREEGLRTVLGGLHATACPEEAAQHADAVVVGDGEGVWGRVLSDAERGELRPVYRAGEPFDLRAAPVPRFELLGSRARPRFTLQTARGCPLACEFCGASRLLGPFREKPASVIERELEAIKRIDPRPAIELADDNTFAGRRNPGELLGVLGRAGVRYFTEADWRIGERPEVVDRLAASGCVQVLVGVEAVVRRYRGMGAKAAALPRVMDAVARIQEHGVAVIGCFVVGADGEDAESMNALGEFLIEAPFADVQLTVQTPFPGTALRRRLEREGRLLADRGWSSCTLFDVAYRPDRMSVEELECGFRNLIRYVFAEGPSARRSRIRREVLAKRPGFAA